MTNSTGYFENVLPNFFNKMFATWRAIEGQEVTEKIRWLCERPNEHLPTLATVVVHHTPLCDCRRGTHPLLIPEGSLTATAGISRSSIKRSPYMTS